MRRQKESLRTPQRTRPNLRVGSPHKPDTQQGKEFWLKELEAFKAEMEKLTGNKITAEKLKASIELINNKRKALKRLSEPARQKPLTNQRLRRLAYLIKSASTMTP